MFPIPFWSILYIFHPSIPSLRTFSCFHISHPRLNKPEIKRFSHIYSRNKRHRPISPRYLRNRETSQNGKRGGVNETNPSKRIKITRRLNSRTSLKPLGKRFKGPGAGLLDYNNSKIIKALYFIACYADC